MAYALDTDIATEAKVTGGAFTTTTNPTDSKVNAIIAEVENLIDARLSLKYILPLTQSGNQILMRGISIALCVERVREIMTVKTGASNVEVVQWKTTADYARKNLERIVSGEIPLVGETLAAASDGVNSYTKDLSPVSECRDPFWKKDRQQW